MTVSATALPFAGASVAAHQPDTPEKVRDAAGQFEALLVGQLLRSVRESAGTDDADGSSSTYMEMAEQQFANAIAARGGLGVAKMIVAKLESPDASQH